MIDSWKFPNSLYPLRVFFLLFPSFLPAFCWYCVRRFNLRFLLYGGSIQTRNFLGLPLLDPSHISMHFILLYFIPIASSKCTSCTSRCVRELLFPMCFVVSLEKAEFLSLFLPITIPSMPLFCLIFSNNIPANIMYRIIDKGHPCRTHLFT